MTPVVIYTDGACKGNPGPGGWGALLLSGNRERELFGGESHTTNNRMELTAVIRALESLKRGCAVEIHTDSQYVKNGIETWIHGWKRNGWKTADRKAVKNAELWRELDALRMQHDVKWYWVKGHADNAGNIRADELANRGVESRRELLGVRGFAPGAARRPAFPFAPACRRGARRRRCPGCRRRAPPPCAPGPRARGPSSFHAAVYSGSSVTAWRRCNAACSASPAFVYSLPSE